MKEYKKIPDFPDFPKDSWDDGIQTNLSSFYQHRAYYSTYEEIWTGKIIAVSSMYGVVAPSPALYNGQNFHCPAVYSASKAGLIGLVRWLASYLGEDNINVNCISPGGVFNNQDTEFVEKLKEKIPLKRMATKNDINGIVKFLLSDDSSYAQGHNFIIDGGYYKMCASIIVSFCSPVVELVDTRDLKSSLAIACRFKSGSGTIVMFEE